MTHEWQGLPVWRILDTNFSDGTAFFETWRAWLSDARRSRVLHYVAFCTQPSPADQLIRACEVNPVLQPLARELTVQWFGLLPGCHRFLLAQGQVILTLCVGDTLHLLRQMQFAADAVVLTCAPPWPDEPNVMWTAKALVRCCRRGTLLTARASGDTAASICSSWRATLRQIGFKIPLLESQSSNSAAVWFEASFDPAWVLKGSRQTDQTIALPIQRCAVVGAGLAGASVAAALARRGWQVRVLDLADAPAAGASGLPVGLVLPHTSSDDCSLSRLSRAGVRLMLQQARQQLALGTQWSPSGVCERQVGGTPKLPSHWPDAGHDWSTSGDTAPTQLVAENMGDALWHPQGAWIKPSALVRAWLRQPGLTFQGHAEVARLRRAYGFWELLDAAGAVLAQAERVVLANACGARALLHALAQDEPDWRARLGHLPASQGMRGLLSWQIHLPSDPAQPAFPTAPVNGSGSVIPHIPIENGNAWFIGSSYQPASQTERSDVDNHARNFEHLQTLLPTLASALESSFVNGGVNAWKGTRCVMADRLPVVGALDAGDQPGLWICAGLGSRGLSFSVLCAELLAARMNAEPLPVEVSLAKALQPFRA